MIFSFGRVVFSPILVDHVPEVIADILLWLRDDLRFFRRRDGFASHVIFKAGCGEEGCDAGGIGADILESYPGLLRNEHESSGVQVALLISDLGVKGSFFNQDDFILLKMFVRRDNFSWVKVLGEEHEMPRAVALRCDLQEESAGISLTRFGPPEAVLAFVFLKQ